MQDKYVNVGLLKLNLKWEIAEISLSKPTDGSPNYSSAAWMKTCAKWAREAIKWMISAFAFKADVSYTKLPNKLPSMTLSDLCIAEWQFWGKGLVWGVLAHLKETLCVPGAASLSIPLPFQRCVASHWTDFGAFWRQANTLKFEGLEILNVDRKTGKIYSILGEKCRLSVYFHTCNHQEIYKLFSEIHSECNVSSSVVHKYALMPEVLAIISFSLATHAVQHK